MSKVTHAKIAYSNMAPVKRALWSLSLIPSEEVGDLSAIMAIGLLSDNLDDAMKKSKEIMDKKSKDLMAIYSDPDKKIVDKEGHWTGHYEWKTETTDEQKEEFFAKSDLLMEEEFDVRIPSKFTIRAAAMKKLNINAITPLVKFLGEDLFEE